MTTAVDNIAATRIDGTAGSIGDFAGKVRLIVNVASQCGLTPQYEGLQALYRQYRDRGFEVLGFPANDFKAQEPGSNEEIVQFCESKYGVEFPMFAKVSVVGEHRHPLYQALIDAQPVATTKGTGLRDRLAANGLLPQDPAGIMWNFEKFLVDREGRVIARFAPDIAPQDPLVVDAIEQALA